MTQRRGRKPAPRGPAGDPDWHFLEARRLQEAGKVRAAMEEAGLGVRLSLGRPEGYLLLGELNLEDGDLDEARKSFTAAAARAQGDLLIMALAGSVQVAVLSNDLAGARALYEKALRADASDPLNLRPGFVEVLVAQDDLRTASAILSECCDESVDLHLLGAVIHWRQGDVQAAVVSARRACLENVHLAARLAGDEVLDADLVHGVPEATPEHAEALLDRVAPLLTAQAATAEFLEAVAMSPQAREERGDLLKVARRLAAESRTELRAVMNDALVRLRDPARIAETSDRLVVALRRDHPSLFAPSSFDV